MSCRGSLTLKNMPMTSVRPRSEYSDETLSINSIYDRQLQKQLEQYDKNTQALKKKLAKEKANLLRSVKVATTTSNCTGLDKSSGIMRPRSQSMVSTNSNAATWAKYVSKRGSNSQQNLSSADSNHTSITRTLSDSSSSNNEEEKKSRPRSNSTGRFRRRLSSQGQTISKLSSNRSVSQEETTISTTQIANDSNSKATTTSSTDQLCIESNDKQSSHFRPRSATFGSATSQNKKSQDAFYLRRKSAEKLYGVNSNPTLSQVASNPHQSKKYFRRCSYAQGDQRSAKMALPLTAVLQPSIDNYKTRLPQIKTDLSP